MTKNLKLAGFAMAAILAAVVFVDAGTCSRAEAPKKSSSIDVASSKAGDNLNLKFKVVPADGMVINKDGPWKLEIKKSDGLSLPTDKLDKAAIDFEMPGYSITTLSKPSAAKGDITYKMIVFVCTKDKTTCVRDVHEGTSSWAVK